MPVRSLNSSVLVWPNKETVVKALIQWAINAFKTNPVLIRVGYFGSYARGDWGVGSDLDVVL
ncbi:MAG: nucleotidyltransferase domain-containing protein, partial [Anaerolineales bacterium]